jgi:hypothetical protein
MELYLSSDRSDSFVKLEEQGSNWVSVPVIDPCKNMLGDGPSVRPPP